MKTRPFAVDAGEYPFPSHWFERRGCAMHYVDEGHGIPVVMCHGNPTWSYLYRHIIKSLAPQFRCIAYDMPGFGFSDHPPGFSYLPQEHAEWVEALIFEHLKLDKFILVVQDWGGPIGLSIATRHPSNIVGMVIGSTWIWTPRAVSRLFSNLMGTRLGQYLILKHNFFAKTIVPMTLAKKGSAATLKAYSDPFPTPKSRRGTAVFPVQIVAAAPWVEETRKGLPVLAMKPVEFVFGLKDLLARPADIALWLQQFPNAGVQKIENANHFSQEDCPESYVVAVRQIARKWAEAQVSAITGAPAGHS